MNPVLLTDASKVPPLLWATPDSYGSENDMNITLSIDEEIVKKVRKIALDRDTTLTAMVREYLTSVANSDSVDRKVLRQR